MSFRVVSRGFVDFAGQNPLKRNLPSASVNDAQGKLDAYPLGSGKNAGQMDSARLDPLSEPRDGFLEGVVVSRHRPSVVCYTTLSTPNNMATSCRLYETWAMSNWPQRDNFKKLVLDYRKEHGLTPEEMAERLGLKPSGLHGLLYDKRTGCPKLETAQNAARVLGVKLSEIVDDPGSDIPGTNPESSEMERVMLRSMGHDITKLTEAQKMAAYNAWKAIVSGYQN